MKDFDLAGTAILVYGVSDMFISAVQAEGRLTASVRGKSISQVKLLREKIEDFPVTWDCASLMLAHLENTDSLIVDEYKVLAHIADRLREAFPVEARQLRFVILDRRYADYYLQKQAFGDAVEERFPKAIDDISGAADCLGLEQGTACVLHLMRVAEIGLKALASEFGIDYMPTWNAYLEHLHRQFRKRRDEKPPAWLSKEPAYREICSDLLSMKIGVRNTTVHVERKYSAEEAEEVFKPVRRFMRRLASILPPISP